MQVNNTDHYSRLTDKNQSIAERVFGTTRVLFEKPVFPKGSADWLMEIPSVIKPYNNTNHHATKMKPVDASKEVNEKVVFDNVQNKKL